MNSHKNPSPRRHLDHLSRADALRHITIWLVLGVAALSLVVFTAVVDAMTQRGDLRAVHPKASNSVNLHEEFSAKGFAAVGVLFPTTATQVGR